MYGDDDTKKVGRGSEMAAETTTTTTSSSMLDDRKKSAATERSAPSSSSVAAAASAAAGVTAGRTTTTTPSLSNFTTTGGAKAIATTTTTKNSSNTISSSSSSSSSSGMIRICVNDIVDHLRCTLCNGCYREPYTTTKCLHTFCKSCLYVAVYDASIYACTICGTYLGKDVSKFANADRTLQDLIDKVLFPDIAAEDERRERQFYKAKGIEPKPQPSSSEDEQEINNNKKKDNGMTSNGNAAAAAGLGKDNEEDERAKKNSKNKKKRRRTSDAAHDATDKSSSSTKAKKAARTATGDDDGVDDDEDDEDLEEMKNGNDVVFRLIPHDEGLPLPPALEHPYMKTDGRIRIGQLKKYLQSEFAAQQQATSTKNNYDILCNGIPLGNELSVTFLLRTVWMGHGGGGVAGSSRQTATSKMDDNDNLLDTVSEKDETITLTYRYAQDDDD